jgi:hypothetical protein
LFGDRVVDILNRILNVTPDNVYKIVNMHIINNNGLRALKPDLPELGGCRHGEVIEILANKVVIGWITAIQLNNLSSRVEISLNSNYSEFKPILEEISNYLLTISGNEVSHEEIPINNTKRRAGRIPPPEEEMRDLVEGWEKVQGRITQEQYCNQKGVSDSTLRRYRRILEAIDNK